MAFPKRGLLGPTLVAALGLMVGVGGCNGPTIDNGGDDLSGPIGMSTVVGSGGGLDDDRHGKLRK